MPDAADAKISAHPLDRVVKRSIHAPVPVLPILNQQVAMRPRTAHYAARGAVPKRQGLECESGGHGVHKREPFALAASEVEAAVDARIFARGLGFGEPG